MHQAVPDQAADVPAVVVPRNMKLLAVPLSQIHNNAQVYGPVISGIPNLLSKFSLNVISD